MALKGISQYYLVVADAGDKESSEDKLLPGPLRHKCAMASRVLGKVTFRQCMMFLNDRVRAANLLHTTPIPTPHEVSMSVPTQSDAPCPHDIRSRTIVLAVHP